MTIQSPIRPVLRDVISAPRFSLSDYLLVSRAGVAWAVDLSGNVKEFGAGEPRITDRGLLVHEAVEQLLAKPVPTSLNGVTKAPSRTVDFVPVGLGGLPSFQTSGGAYLYVSGHCGAPPLLAGQTYAISFIADQSTPALIYPIPAIGYQDTLVIDLGGGIYRHSVEFTPTEDGWLSYHLDRIDGLITGFNLTKTDYLAPISLTSGLAPADNIQLNDRAKSQMYDLGPELVVNGDFSDGLTEWTIDGASPPTHEVTLVEGGIRFRSDTASPILRLIQTNIMELGKTYRVSVTATEHVAGALKSDNIEPAGNVFVAGNGTVSIVGEARHTKLELYRNSPSVDVVISNISIREVIPSDFVIEMEFTTPEDHGNRPSSYRVLRGEGQAYPIYVYKNSDAISFSAEGGSAVLGTAPASSKCKVALTVSKDGGVRGSLNGAAVVFDSNADLSKLGLGSVWLGSGQGVSDFLNSHIHDIRVTKGSMTDAELQARSAL